MIINDKVINVEKEQLNLMNRFKTATHDDLSLEMKKYAKENKVPIIQDESLELILQLLRIKQPVTVLELGTAIGYSSLMMARHLPNCRIVTVERDEIRYLEAVQYHKRSTIGNRVILVKGDALELKTQQLPIQQFDAIFIDAAKAQYQKFFEKYEPLLKDEGLIISDNLLFHGYVFDHDQKQSRNLKQLVRKIKQYHDWLATHPHYHTLMLPVGDGIAISLKKD